MPDVTVNVRYMVDDVEAAVAFYTTHWLHALVQRRAGVRRRHSGPAAPPAQWAG